MLRTRVPTHTHTDGQPENLKLSRPLEWAANLRNAHENAE